MIVVVTPNPAVDVTYRVAEQRIGETQRVLDVARRPGGKGLNVGRVLAATGVDTRAVLPLGGTPGRWIADALDALGVAHSDVTVHGETRTTVTVVDDLAHPTMFGEPGPVLDPAEWDAVAVVVSALVDDPRTTALVVSGSLPGGTDPAVVGRWVGAARGYDVLTVVDCSGGALLAAADAGATICKPNREELLDATGAPDERSGALALLRRGARIVVVSRGADGIAAHTLDRTIEVPAVPGVSGNPTGAGDAATAGLVRALVGAPFIDDTGLLDDTGPLDDTGLLDDTGPLDDALLRRALRSAAAHGAAAVLQPVAGEVDPAVVQRFLDHDHNGTRTSA
ncbi:1-phosphofructokinase family hexose kinase [Curtobacterium sp. PhB115]|uniref:1-phosphofructokinase family hexose kinase n=1 Tax=Curtobacterium sp. PhB115 TaxID=2485173 RepID=UPI000F4CE4BF|nr:PfkB family carbohydrate kinase [Curtobacterium sp. PhB115]ROP72503.1 tagatose 6-phosphate kinase [Curtobacterium sp. PhB115]